jgi:hypothetical protein
MIILGKMVFLMMVNLGIYLYIQIQHGITVFLMVVNLKVKFGIMEFSYMETLLVVQIIKQPAI